MTFTNTFWRKYQVHDLWLLWDYTELHTRSKIKLLGIEFVQFAISCPSDTTSALNGLAEEMNFV